MELMSIQVAIRSLMRSRGLTFDDMAERLGVSKPTVYHAVAGRQKTVSVDKAVEMLGVLGYKLVVLPEGQELPSGAISMKRRSDNE